MHVLILKRFYFSRMIRCHNFYTRSHIRFNSGSTLDVVSLVKRSLNFIYADDNEMYLSNEKMELVAFPLEIFDGELHLT